MPKIVENALLIYTDGSLYPKGRRGGYSMVFVHVNTIGEETIVREEAPPGSKGATNNRMELQACVHALKVAPELECFSSVHRIGIRTDSRYVKDNYTSAIGAWRTQKWRNRDGRPVDNADLWKDFVLAYSKIRKPKLIEWVKAHAKGKAKNAYNERADDLAKNSAKSPLARNVFRSSVRRKLAPGRTKVGSVAISGQVMLIYIVEVHRMRIQKEWKYRYQVVSPDRADRFAIDWIYSDENMRDGHFYEVQVNHDAKYPRVLRIGREVPRDEALKLVHAQTDKSVVKGP